MLYYVIKPITRSSVEMMGLIGAGNNPMVGMTVACAVATEEAQNNPLFIRDCETF